jgi:hypothetical protein
MDITYTNTATAKSPVTAYNLARGCDVYSLDSDPTSLEDCIFAALDDEGNPVFTSKAGYTKEYEWRPSGNLDKFPRLDAEVFVVGESGYLTFDELKASPNLDTTLFLYEVNDNLISKILKYSVAIVDECLNKTRSYYGLSPIPIIPHPCLENLSFSLGTISELGLSDNLVEGDDIQATASNALLFAASEPSSKFLVLTRGATANDGLLHVTDGDLVDDLEITGNPFDPVELVNFDTLEYSVGLSPFRSADLSFFDGVSNKFALLDDVYKLCWIFDLVDGVPQYTKNHVAINNNGGAFTENSPQGCQFTNEGGQDYLYVVGSNTDSVHKYSVGSQVVNLGQPDVDVGTYVESYDLSGVISSPQALRLYSNGMWYIVDSVSNEVYEFNNTFTLQNTYTASFIDAGTYSSFRSMSELPSNYVITNRAGMRVSSNGGSTWQNATEDITLPNGGTVMMGYNLGNYCFYNENFEPVAHYDVSQGGATKWVVGIQQYEAGAALVNAYIELGASGLSIVDYTAQQGGVPTINGTQLEMNGAYWLSTVELSNGDILTLAEGDGNTVYDIVNGNEYIVAGGTWTTQDEIHNNLLRGFDLWQNLENDNYLRVPFLQNGTSIKTAGDTIDGYVFISRNPAISNGWNMSENLFNLPNEGLVSAFDIIESENLNDTLFCKQIKQ